MKDLHPALLGVAKLKMDAIIFASNDVQNPQVHVAYPHLPEYALRHATTPSGVVPHRAHETVESSHQHLLLFAVSPTELPVD